MNENEKDLIRLIREHEDPELALEIATLVILDYLKLHESSEEQAVACL